jgi:transposase InsO family protein
VARIVARCGWARLHVLQVPPTSRPYERAWPGELVHLDITKLGLIVPPGHRVSRERRHTVRGAGWEFSHVAVDDASRLAVGEGLHDERSGTAAGFLRRTVRGLRRLGLRVAAVMPTTDRATGRAAFRRPAGPWGVRHLYARRYTPRTNGKIERSIKTALLEWAPYARVYRHSEERRYALTTWLHHYNWHRPHTAVGGRPPITRVIPADDLLSLHSYRTAGSISPTWQKGPISASPPLAYVPGKLARS